MENASLNSTLSSKCPFCVLNTPCNDDVHSTLYFVPMVSSSEGFHCSQCITTTRCVVWTTSHHLLLLLALNLQRLLLRSGGLQMEHDANDMRHLYELALHPFVIFAPHASPTLCVPSSIPILSPFFLYHPYIPSF